MNADRRSLAEILSDAQLSLLSAESLRSDQSYFAVAVRDADLRTSRLSEVLFEQAFFQETDISGCKWSSLELVELLVSNCTLANADWSGARPSARSSFIALGSPV